MITNDDVGYTGSLIIAIKKNSTEYQCIFKHYQKYYMLNGFFDADINGKEIFHSYWGDADATPIEMYKSII